MNGRRTLDTASSNYSYGSLQQVLQSGLNVIGFDDDIKSVLVLGLGGGSVIATIREDFNSQAFIAAVETDPVIIEIARKDFEIYRYPNLVITNSDALDFVSQTQSGFDLVIVDLFIGNVVPEKFTEDSFIAPLADHITEGGWLIFNVMNDTMPKGSLEELTRLFLENHIKIEEIKEVKGTNKLIIGKKL